MRGKGKGMWGERRGVEGEVGGDDEGERRVKGKWREGERERKRKIGNNGEKSDGGE